MDIGAIVWAVMTVMLVVIVVFARRGKRKGRSIGTGVIGANYEWLSRDKRQAIEYIVEDKAEARDPEDAEGNLPELERPKRPRGSSLE